MGHLITIPECSRGNDMRSPALDRVEHGTFGTLPITVPQLAAWGFLVLYEIRRACRLTQQHCSPEMEIESVAAWYGKLPGKGQAHPTAPKCP